MFENDKHTHSVCSFCSCHWSQRNVASCTAGYVPSHYMLSTRNYSDMNHHHYHHHHQHEAAAAIAMPSLLSFIKPTNRTVIVNPKQLVLIQAMRLGVQNIKKSTRCQNRNEKQESSTFAAKSATENRTQYGSTKVNFH